MRYGVGAGASRLVSGNMTIHRRLEEQLAEFKGTPACVLFGSGYLANTGVVSALAQRGRRRLLGRPQPRQHRRRLPARARGDVRLRPLRHGAPRVGAPGGGRPRQPDRHRRRLLDGRRRRAAARDRRAGAALRRARDGGRRPRHRRPGPGGPRRGGRRRASRTRSTSSSGTLGKSLGSYGAYVCCDRTMAKYLVNTARSLIFSTALPPPAVAGALAALELLVEQPGARAQAAAERAAPATRRSPTRASRPSRRRRSCRS